MYNVDRISDLIKKRGLNVKYVFEQLGSTRQKLYDWKRGKSNPSDADIKALADMLSTSVEYLNGETDDERPKFPLDIAADLVFPQANLDSLQMPEIKFETAEIINQVERDQLSKKRAEDFNKQKKLSPSIIDRLSKLSEEDLDIIEKLSLLDDKTREIALAQFRTLVDLSKQNEE